MDNVGNWRSTKSQQSYSAEEISSVFKVLQLFDFDLSAAEMALEDIMSLMNVIGIRPKEDGLEAAREAAEGIPSTGS